MIFYINDKGEIKDVNSTTDKSLRAVDVGDGHPFDEDTSVEKIKCYRIELNGDSVEYYQALVDDKIIEHIDALSKENEALKKENASTQAQLDYVTMMTDIEI